MRTLGRGIKYGALLLGVAVLALAGCSASLPSVPEMQHEQTADDLLPPELQRMIGETLDSSTIRYVADDGDWHIYLAQRDSSTDRTREYCLMMTAGEGTQLAGCSASAQITIAPKGDSGGPTVVFGTGKHDVPKGCVPVSQSVCSI